MLGMISVFGWNAQIAAQAEAVQKAETAKQAQIAAKIAASRAAAKPHVKVVVVTVPAPIRTRYVTQSNNSASSQNSSNYNAQNTTNSVRPQATVRKTTKRVTRPAPVVRPVQVVVNPPAQTSQATSGGSRKP